MGGQTLFAQRSELCSAPSGIAASEPERPFGVPLRVGVWGYMLP
jgi:hypothetical protein